MSKIAEAYGRSKWPKANIKGIRFKYSDLGNCYSYVIFIYEKDGIQHSDELCLEKFFDWIGEQLLKIN